MSLFCHFGVGVHRGRGGSITAVTLLLLCYYTCKLDLLFCTNR